MTKVIERVEEWAQEYEESRSFDSVSGRVVPKVNIGAIRGGIPYRPNRTSPHCAIYVDVRTIPGEDPLRVQRELETVVASAEVGASVEMFLARSGHEGKNVEPLVGEVRRCCREVIGEEPPASAHTEIASMWRDINVFNSMGIPAVTFGPPRRKDENGNRLYLDIKDLVNMAAIYAHVAHRICNRSTDAHQQ